MSIVKRKPQKLQIAVFADAVRDIIGDEPFQVRIEAWRNGSMNTDYDTFAVWLPNRGHHVPADCSTMCMEACLLMLKHRTEEMT